MNTTCKNILIATLIIGLGTFSLTYSLLAANESTDTNYSPVDVKNGGTISGVIAYEGEIPTLMPIEVNKDRNVCGKHKPSEALLVDPETKGVQNVVIFLKGINSGKNWKTNANLEMDQKSCLFTPHVLVVPVGQEFNMLNNDGILHNIHTRSEVNKEINKAQPKFLKRMKLSFEEPEFIKVTCDVHSWMQGWIVVADNPYYAVTNAQGKFELTHVPPGTYELEIWQEKLGRWSRQVEVKPGKVTTLNDVLK